MKLADGSNGKDRMGAAGIRAAHAWMTLIEKAVRLCEALDEVPESTSTAPLHLDDDDSLVIALQDFHASECGVTTRKRK